MVQKGINGGQWHDLDYYEKTINYCIENEYNELGIKLVDIALKQHPYSVLLKILKVHLFINIDKKEKALDLLEHILQIQPSDTECLILKVNLCYILDKNTPEELIDILEKALGLGLNKNELHLEIAYLYQDIQQYEDAIYHYEQIDTEYIDEEFIEYYVNSCLMLGEKGEQRWLNFFENLTDKEPSNPILWYHYALAHNRVENYDQALDYLDFVEALDPKIININYEKGSIYFWKNEYPKSIAYFEQALNYEKLEKKYEESIYLLIAFNYKAMGKKKDAFLYYQKVYQLNADSWEAVIGMVDYLKNHNQLLLAFKILKQALVNNPNDGNYWYKLAGLEEKLDNFVGLEEAYQKAKLYHSQSPNLWLNWAKSYANKNDFLKASQIIIEGLESIPDNANLNYMAVVYFLKIQKYQIAKDYLEIALLLDFEGHKQIFQYFQHSFTTQQVLAKIINLYKETGY